jgi:hypothetical protein
MAFFTFGSWACACLEPRKITACSKSIIIKTFCFWNSRVEALNNDKNGSSSRFQLEVCYPHTDIMEL